jgi:preprotein translocase subunit SecB
MSDQNSISLNSIILLESSFNRTWTIDFDNPDFYNKVDVDVENIKDKSFLNVIVSVNFTAGVKDDIQIKAFVKMVGVFEISESQELTIEQFGNINGPAIIFPFVREHLSSLSVKAGISPILLSPINFVTHSEIKKKN